MAWRFGSKVGIIGEVDKGKGCGWGRYGICLRLFW
jgi:hypothetical protein